MFVKGTSGHPEGRPKGKNKATVLRDAQKKAMETLMGGVHRGEIAACAAILSIKEPI